MAKKKSKPKTAKTSIYKSDSAASGLDSLSDGSSNPGVSLNVCRLCETKDGPFLDVFESDKIIAKKIEKLLPFTVLENDDLPSKICFRCSAKVEELHEFVQKCTRTQENLNKAIGKNTFFVKNKTRILWDEKLNECNMSNEDICDAIVKKAMQALTDNPPSIETDERKEERQEKIERRVSLKRGAKNPENNINYSEDSDALPQKQLKLEKEESKVPIQESPRQYKNSKPKKSIDKTEQPSQETLLTNSFSFDYNDSSHSHSDNEKPKVIETTKVNESQAFNIMDHISTIKVNGVGILFQCKLCNRNFLKKEVVLSHGCAKTGKLESRKTTPPPEPPKITANTVKYINTKAERELKKQGDEPMEKIEPEMKPKPKIGPASRVRKNVEGSPSVGMMIHPRAPTPPTSLPSVQFPTTPSLNSRYKLVPGPNNTFSLIEDPNSEEIPLSSKGTHKNKDIEALLKSRPGLVVKSEVITVDETPNSNIESSVAPVAEASNSRKRKAGPKGKTQTNVEPASLAINKPVPQPYPVGMFQSHINKPASIIETPPMRSQPTFTTPAMRKQSYTVVQTGNPSKLLISTRPTLHPLMQAPIEEPKVIRQTRNTTPTLPKQPQEPFRVTSEDVSPQTSGFFTYVNMDPLLKPLHDVPVDNIIQESQISTSTSLERDRNKERSGLYPCNLCGEKFTREKKLQSHIQAHYTKMDEEDQMRDKYTKKRK